MRLLRIYQRSIHGGTISPQLKSISLLPFQLGAAWCSGKLVRVSHYVAPMTRN